MGPHRRRARLLLGATLAVGLLDASLTWTPTAGPAAADPLGAEHRWSGHLDVLAAATSLRQAPNGPGACDVAATATLALPALPPGTTVVSLRLQWAASGPADTTLVVDGQVVTAEATTTVAAAGGPASASTADVTDLLAPGSVVEVGGLDVSTTGPVCDDTAVFAGVAAFVVVDDPAAPWRTVVLTEGLDLVGRGSPPFEVVVDDLPPAAGTALTGWAVVWEGDGFGADEGVDVDGVAVAAPGWGASSATGPWGVDVHRFTSPLATGATATRLALRSGDDQVLVGAVAVVVDAAPRPPAVSASTASLTTERTRVDVLGAVADADDDVDRGTLRIVASPDVVTARVVDGVLELASPPGFVGVDHLRWAVCDRSGLCADAELAITAQVAEPPEHLVRTTEAGRPLPLEVVAMGGVVDPGSVAVVATPAHGTARVEGGAVVYAPAPGFVGADALSFRSCGFDGTCRTRDVELRIVP